MSLRVAGVVVALWAASALLACAVGDGAPGGEGPYRQDAPAGDDTVSNTSMDAIEQAPDRETGNLKGEDAFDYAPDSVGSWDGPPLEYCMPPDGPGVVIISEILTRPTDGRKTKQWFELYNTRDIPYCLNGVRMETSGTAVGAHDIGSPKEIEIPPFGFAVIGGEETRLFADDTWKPSFELPETEGVIKLSFEGIELDAVVIGTGLREIPPPREGESIFVCKESLLPDGNNLKTSWSHMSYCVPPHCVDLEPFNEFGDLGTPNEMNPECNQ